MPDLAWEKSLQRDGYRLVAGIDEAGRGPLAGPVVAAAAILPVRYRHKTLNDSKQLSEKKREAIYEELIADNRITWCSAAVDSPEIDKINILKATHAAMRRAAEGLKTKPDAVLIDGLEVRGFPIHQKALVKGDSISLSIAAASVIAKVERDRLMLEYAEKYPEYGFEKHKGYGTKLHLEKLRHHGPCPIHRQSFRPVAQLSLPFDEGG